MFTEEITRKLATLSRLELSDAEVEKMTPQLEKIVSYVDKLNTLDTSGVAPLTTPFEVSTPLRQDLVVESPGAQKMLSSAPEAIHDNYKVPQVLGSSSEGGA